MLASLTAALILVLFSLSSSFYLNKVLHGDMASFAAMIDSILERDTQSMREQAKQIAASNSLKILLDLELPAQANRVLKRLAKNSVFDEFWLLDKDGKLVACTHSTTGDHPVKSPLSIRSASSRFVARDGELFLAVRGDIQSGDVINGAVVGLTRFPKSSLFAELEEMNGMAIGLWREGKLLAASPGLAESGYQELEYSSERKALTLKSGREEVEYITFSRYSTSVHSSAAVFLEIVRREDVARTLFHPLWMIYLAGLLLIIGCFILFTRYVYSRLVRPIETLSAQAKAIRDHRIAPKHDGAVRFDRQAREIKDLYESIFEMVYALQSSRTTAELAEQKYRSIVENAPEGIYQSTPEGRFVTANPSLARILGYDSPQEVIDGISHIPTQLYVDPADRDDFFKLMLSQGVTDSYETQFYRKDRSKIWVSLSAKPVVNDQGEVVYIEGILEDITQRKRAEEQLSEYQDNLQTLVRKRTEELTSANALLLKEVEDRKRAESEVRRAKSEVDVAYQRLREVDSMKTDFLAMVSHEIRTPMTSILGFAHIIQHKFSGEEGAGKVKMSKVQRYVDIIISESERLTALLNDVLDITKLESGRMQWNMEPLSVNDVIEQATEVSMPLFDEKDLMLIQDVHDDMPLILGDRERLVQVLLNLFSNAVKFTEKGVIACRAKLKEERVVISVADQGMGIPTSELGVIFEKFRQVKDERESKPMGTGLGLPISQEIVEQHGGIIRVESEIGKGSIFTFSLPLLPRDAAK